LPHQASCRKGRQQQQASERLAAAHCCMRALSSGRPNGGANAIRCRAPRRRPKAGHRRP
jgi:hypothetical protein